MAADTKHLKKRYETLSTDTERKNWESHCEEVAAVCLPRKKGFVGPRTAGDKRMQRIYSSVGIRALELLAAGLHGFATNPAAKWFGLAMTDEAFMNDIEVKKWLSDVEDILWSRMYAPGTNFITAFHEAYLELGGLGTTMLTANFDEKDQKLRFECRTLHNIVIDESNKGVVDAFYRKFCWTVRQIVQEWGVDGVSDRIREAYQQKQYDRSFEIIHAVYPRDGIDDNYGMKSRQNLPYANVYFECDSGYLLEEGGEHEFPAAVPRWSKLPNERYGRSPGMTALPDVNMYQQIKMTMIKAGQKAVDPPLFARDDGFVKPFRLIPGGVNYVRGNPQDQIYPMPFNGSLPFAQQELETLKYEIFDAFYVNQLQITNDAQMTATEVMQRTQERMRLLGPVLGRLESELLGPLITRVFGLLFRAGIIPPAPDAIAEREFTVRYVSPIAQAQRAVEIDTWRQFVAANEIYLQSPETAKDFFMLYPLNKVSKHFAKLLNLDPDMAASDEQIEEGQRQSQMQQMAQMAGPFQQGAAGVKALSEAGMNAGGMVQGVSDGAQQIQEMAGNIDPAQIQQIMAGLQPQGNA